MIIEAERRVPVRIRVAVRPGGFGQRWRGYLYSDTEFDHF
jgi:hypothetical protein